MIPDLFVLRHGETIWNVEGRLQGSLDSELTDLGRDQARAQGAILSRVLPEGARAFSSPQGRAVQTGAIALAGSGLKVTQDARLAEVSLGTWQGETLESLAPRVLMEPELLWKLTAPQGERLDDLIARCTAFLDDLSGPAVIVTHGVTSRALRGIALGVAPENWADLAGGQGVVHHLCAGKARVLE